MYDKTKQTHHQIRDTHDGRSPRGPVRVVAIKVCTASVFSGLFAIFGIASASAEDLLNVFSHAVVDGTASAPLPDIPTFQNAIRIVQQRTGSDAPLAIYAERITRFQNQPRCGRVVFMIGQPATHKAWKDMGGQLNICEDGGPPLRMCPGKPDVLLPVDAMCPGGTRPVDTPEVTAAIQQAVAQGSLTPDAFAARERALRPASDAFATQGKGVHQ
ncbi:MULTISPECIES: hypothetical protein [Paraburkholderia]|uniref:Uncharacterized protein n=1 Tax=Paraburkholderia madseniana TaxID=2599607 RepID=A0AAP5F0W4_9BURK|nr:MULTISPECIES: hypothetical protein [Paraburkholderia]MCX4151023.1 hypothetical protein [Paraburkholderia madseniana]MCX4176663.1 hypothetical protein [Paraburkholderia madseniana]MDN7153955.1 hypothetical protein [Paraburkholderia sp. WS6]MDQ6412837.1 hypothetical protein [Paraburkholderia madseniana]MDQ6464654.1 hypothetical protein [Paraburkholderia madseniana]